MNEICMGEKGDFQTVIYQLHKNPQDYDLEQDCAYNRTILGLSIICYLCIH